MSKKYYINKGFSSLEFDNGTQNGIASKGSSLKENASPPSYSCRHPIRSLMTYLRHILGDTKLGVHVLVCIFAISSWADLNSMWSELPQLVLNLPEGWDLPSFIIIISQIANVGPLVFVLLTILYPGTKSKIEKVTSMVIILSDVIAVVLMAFYWDHTSHVAGKERSTALFALNFVFALGDCTSSLAFFAFMSTLKPAYMATYFVGEGLSGMLPAFIALGQGVSDINCVHQTITQNATYSNGTGYNQSTDIVYPKFGEPGFSVQTYFLIIAGILAGSAIAFILLNSLPYCKSEMVSPETNEKDTLKESSHDIASEAKGSDEIVGKSTTTKCRRFSQKIKDFIHFPEISRWKLTIHMTITVIINMTLTTFLSSIQSYTTLPYGLDPYHMATNLAQITNPVACFLAVFVMTTSIPIISLFFVLGQVGVAYIIYTAAMSPTPPLHGQDDGGVLIVALWVAVTFLLIYAKVCVAGVMREHGRRALIWLGVATQAGCLVGAITGFLLVNHYELFADAPYC